MRSNALRLKLIGGAVLILFGFAWLNLLFILGNIFGSYNRMPEVSVFLENGVTPAQVGRITEKLSQLPQVGSWTYQSEEAATQEFKRMFADKPALVENLEPGTLPSSFRISLTRAGAIDEVAASLKGQAGVDAVLGDSGWFLRVLHLMNVIRIVSMIAAGAAICGGVFLIGRATPNHPGTMGLGGAPA